MGPPARRRQPVTHAQAAIGEREGAWLVATDARTVSATVDGSALGQLKAQLSFGHFVSFGARAVPDALLPWNGSERQTEQPNQPLYLHVLVPPDARPGNYAATVTVTADGKPTPVRVSIRVFAVQLPAPSAVHGNLLTSFHVMPQSYVSKVDQLYHLGSNAARSATDARLFSFLAAYRISPAGWGFGEPTSRAGYLSYLYTLDEPGLEGMRLVAQQAATAHRWDLLDVVRRKRGPAAVRAILGSAGLFSAAAQRVELASSVGCELHGSTRFSWPLWSHDASTARRIEAAHLQALRAASG